MADVFDTPGREIQRLYLAREVGGVLFVVLKLLHKKWHGAYPCHVTNADAEKR